VPADTPTTTPDAEPIVAIAVLLLTHVPPVEAVARGVVRPAHTSRVPVITAGIGFVVTVVVVVVAQPFDAVTVSV
jgi:hypothetical protein